MTLPNDSDLAALQSPEVATGHMSILPNGDYDTWPLLGNYPTATIVRSQITGQATATLPGDPNSPWKFTPKGYADNCGSLRLQLSTSWSECSSSRFRIVQGEVKLFVGYFPSLCTQTAPPVCATYVGGFDARQDRLDASLTVWPTDTTVRGGTAATIRWRADPDSLQGIKTPLTAKRLFF